MVERVAAYLVACRSFVAVSIIVAFCIAAIYLMALRWFRWSTGRIRLFGLLFGMGRRGLFAVSMWYLRMMYLIVFLVKAQELTRFSIVMVFALGVGSGALAGGLIGGVREICNSALISAGLMVGNMLITYMREIQFDWSIVTVYGLLSLFILLYNLYFMMRDIRSISKGRKETDVEAETEQNLESEME